MKLNSRSGAAGLVALVTTALSAPLLAETEATVNGVDIDSSIVDVYVESRTQQPVAAATAEQRAALLDELTDIYLITTQDRANELADDPRVKAQAELQYRGLLAQLVASDFITRNAATEEEIFAEYSNQMVLQSGEEFKARHILVETADEALALIKELEGGADFAELAKEHSTGPTGPNGGDLGWFGPNDMVGPFSAAVKELEDGAFTTEPVQTQFGWHVVLREDSRERTPPTLESVRETIKQRVEQQKLQSYISSLRAANAEDE